MFFIFGVNTKRDVLDINDLKICSVCGSYGRYEAFVDYNSFSLFFIPILKWGRKYYVKSTCCNSLFSISEDIGRGIESGRITTIRDEDLKPINVNYNRVRTCTNCGYNLDSDHEYCPKCGTKN